MRGNAAMKGGLRDSELQKGKSRHRRSEVSWEEQRRLTTTPFKLPSMLRSDMLA